MELLSLHFICFVDGDEGLVCLVISRINGLVSVHVWEYGTWLIKYPTMTKGDWMGNRVKVQRVLRVTSYLALAIDGLSEHTFSSVFAEIEQSK